MPDKPRRQSCSIHVYEKDGTARLFVNFDPPLPSSEHTPNQVEAVVASMLAAARSQHPELEA